MKKINVSDINHQKLYLVKLENNLNTLDDALYVVLKGYGDYKKDGKD